MPSWTNRNAMLNWGTAPHDEEAIGEGPHSAIFDAVPQPQRPNEPTTVDDTTLVQANPPAPLGVNVLGIVNTRPVPTIAAGSRSITLSTALAAAKVGGNDPRRAAMTIISANAFYLSNSVSQVEQGFCALIPANTAVVLTHRDEVWISAPVGATLPFVVGILTEAWAL